MITGIKTKENRKLISIIHKISEHAGGLEKIWFE